MLLLTLGSLKLAVDSEQVLTTCDWMAPTPLPFAPEPVRGIVSIDGRMFTVLEIGHLFGETTVAERKSIVAFRGDEQMAIAVDATEMGTGEQIQVLELSELFASMLQGRDRRRRRF